MNRIITSNNKDLSGDNLVVSLIDQSICLFCHKYLFDCKCTRQICVCNFPESGEICAIHKDVNKETRGGRRDGSGRPKKEPTKILSYRVPEKLALKIDKKIKTIIKSIL